MFAWLLRLFPRAFRDTHGASMQRLLEDMRREGSPAGPGFVARLVWDTMKNAAAEWLVEVRRRRGRRKGRRQFAAPALMDVRYAVRQVTRQPAYSATVVLLMALGIGGNVAVFRVLNGMFLRPLPFDRPEQLVDLDETAPQWNLEYVSVAFPDFVR